MYHVETIDIDKRHPMLQYADNYAAYANNMFNVANFYIRNLMTGLKKDADKRTANESEVIAIVRDAIPPINKSLKDKYDQKVGKIRADKSLTDEEKAKKIKKVKHSEFSMPTAEKWFAGEALLEAVFKWTDNADYRACHVHVAQNAVGDCCEAWSSYFALLKTSGLSGRPNIPRYKKSGGRSTAVFSNQGCRIKNGFLTFPRDKTDKTNASLDVRKLPHASKDKLMEVRIVPYFGSYQVQIVTDDGVGIGDILPKEEEMFNATENPKGVMTLDPGLDNFAAIADNKGNTPIVIKGGALKSRNQWFNKRMSFLKSKLMEGHDPKTYRPQTTKRMRRLSRKREAFIDDTFYKYAHFIFRTMKSRQLEYLIVGHNKEQKNGISLGHKTNQAFVQLPFARFNEILAVVARKYGIRVIIREESYTSKACFAARDFIPVYGEEGADAVTFSGKRIRRGLYKQNDGKIINADVNGSCNIGRKYDERVFPKDLDTGYLYKTVKAMTYKDILLESQKAKTTI